VIFKQQLPGTGTVRYGIRQASNIGRWSGSGRDAMQMKEYMLKVDGNEKLGGLRFLQLLGIGLGPWRSMSIFILNMPFANAKHISVSALSSKMNRRLLCN
jgi:hypothetical protein